MTLSAERLAKRAPRRSLIRPASAVLGLSVLAALLVVLPVAANGPSPSATPLLVAQETPPPTPTSDATPATPQPPAATPAPGPTYNPDATPIPDCPLPPENQRPVNQAGQQQPHPLCPAVPTGNPLDVLAWLFTPIFQTLFMALAVFYQLTGDVGLAIVLLTVLIKTLLIPLFRRQIVAQRRMQMLQPEIRAIQQKFKGNRSKISEETMRLYRERGVNPAAGCLPMLLQLFLLLPIYQVVNQGLSATRIDSMLQVFGQPILEITCQERANPFDPCIDPSIWWLGGLDAHASSAVFIFLGIHFSLLAVFAAALQFVQTRMMMPPASDPQARAQQRIFMFLPLLVLLWGFLPAGLFLYWIVFSAYSIVQQYFIAGWGSLFPIFGWTPGFAQDHQPRFPVDIPPPKRPTEADGGDKQEDKRSPSDRAAGTIRQARQKGRTSRRGRRR